VRAFLFGIVLVIIGVVVSTLSKNWRLIFDVSGMIGLGSWVLAGIFSGAFIGGDRIRANYHTEDKDNREQKTNWSTTLFLLGLPNIIAVVIVMLIR
jgi:hypothetical protein